MNEIVTRDNVFEMASRAAGRVRVPLDPSISREDLVSIAAVFLLRHCIGKPVATSIKWARGRCRRAAAKSRIHQSLHAGADGACSPEVENALCDYSFEEHINKHEDREELARLQAQMPDTWSELI